MESPVPIRVLIVDDEERFRRTTETILRKRGFAVRSASDGLKALDTLGRESFDVVVLDLKMPGKDGNEILREMKQRHPDLQVILLTGHGSYDAAVAGLRRGAFYYLSKPCDIDVLVDRIREAFARKESLAEAERRVRDIMVPLSEFSRIREDRPVAEAVEILAQSFAKAAAGSLLAETVHRTVLVLDHRGAVIGVLSFQDLLRSLQPPYLRKALEKPYPREAVALEPPSHAGMFTVMAQEVLKRPVRELMSAVPPLIDAEANLMEAAGRMLVLRAPRLLVVEAEKPVGVVREQDLFFEIVRILREQG